MKTLLFLFLFLSMSVCAFATDVSLQWDPNTETDLAGYRVYMGTNTNKPELFVKLKETTSPQAMISSLDPSRSYSFAVTAFNTSGMESAYSNIVTIPAAPSIPNGLKWSLTLTVTGVQ